MASDRGSPAKAWLRAIELTADVERNPRRLFADIVEGWANKQPDHPALVSKGGNVSYHELAQRINGYARWALSVGVSPGDRVSLIVPTGPDYIAAWLGISRVGGVVALINTNLVGQSLAHCINVVGAHHVIVGRDLVPKLEAAHSQIIGHAKVWYAGGGPNELCIDRQLAEYSAAPLSQTEFRNVAIADLLF